MMEHLALYTDLASIIILILVGLWFIWQEPSSATEEAKHRKFLSMTSRQSEDIYFDEEECDAVTSASTASRLDLARMYFEMGKKDDAYRVIQALLDQGGHFNVQQKAVELASKYL